MGQLSKHFKRSEFACKCGCGFDTVDFEMLLILEDLRGHFGKPVHILSGCRCRPHNARVGGSPDSWHPKGRAGDVVVEDVDPADVYAYLCNKYPDRYGIGSYPTFTHIDSRSKAARWSGT